MGVISEDRLAAQSTPQPVIFPTAIEVSKDSHIVSIMIAKT